MHEFALLIVPLFTIAAGVLEIGLLYRSAALANSSTRSGVRLASAVWATVPDASKNILAVDQIRLTVETDLSTRSCSPTPLRVGE